MRQLIALALTLISILPAAAQDAACSPDLSDVSALVEGVQVAIDAGDDEITLNSLAALRSETQLLEATCADYAPENAGDSRTNPVPVGQSQRVQTDAFEGTLTLKNYLDNADELVGQLSASNQQAATGTHYVALLMDLHCDRTPSESCRFDVGAYKLVGSMGFVYEYLDNPVFGLDHDREFFGGSTLDRIAAFQVADEDSDFVLIAGFGDERVYFATE